MSRLRAVSLFSNCGAGDFGYRNAGFRFDVLAEIDRGRLGVAERNHPDADAVAGDLRETWPEVVVRFRRRTGEERLDLLAACPPCQGMSTARRERGSDDDHEAGARDGRNLLVVPIAKVALELKPRFVVVENVPAFLTRKVPEPGTGDPISAARLLIELLDGEYEAYPFLTDLCDYGVPQHRVRAFLTFVRNDEGFVSRFAERRAAPFPRPSHAPEDGEGPISLREALEELDAPKLDASHPEKARSEEYGVMHSVPSWDDRLYQMVEAIPPNSGGSAWENSSCLECGDVEVGDEDAVCPDCDRPLPRPIVPTEEGSYRLVKGFRTSSYRRMAPGSPASTVTTANGRIGSSSTIHPWENRVLSALECAHLQTLPSDFDWGEDPEVSLGVNAIRAMIGEAVPPLFTEKHGGILASCLAGETADWISIEDPRCGKARQRLAI